MTNNPTIDGVSRELLERLASMPPIERDDPNGSGCDLCPECFGAGKWNWKAGKVVSTDAIEHYENCAIVHLRALLDAPPVEPANALREHCKQCADVVNTWPEWKQNCLGGAPAVERQGHAPEIIISQCQFFGLNQDDSEPFGFQGVGIMTLTHFRMIGWRCYGPSIQAELTDEQILEAMREHIYAADGGYVFDTAKPAVIAAGRALIAAALNNKPSIEVTP